MGVPAVAVPAPVGHTLLSEQVVGSCGASMAGGHRIVYLCGAGELQYEIPDAAAQQLREFSRRVRHGCHCGSTHG